MRLAGTYHPIPYLLEQIELFLPGVRTVNALWNNGNGSICTEEGEVGASDFNGRASVQKWRNKSIKQEWLDVFDPFSFHKAGSKQLTLEDEEKLNILVFYFDSPHDDLQDLVAIHFPPAIFLSSLNATFSGLSTKERMILSNLLSSILRAEHSRVINERKLLKNLEHHQLLQTKKISQLETDLKYSEQLYTSALRTIINDVIKSFEKELNKSITVQDEVIYLLSKERLTQEEIHDTIKSAIFVAYNLGISQATIEVNSSLIDLNQDLQIKKSRDKTETNDKIKLLLDRYEESAEKVQMNGEQVNGKNVARKLDPPVTPPAITDAVKKNEKRIHFLLERYPNHWRLIRSKLRPLYQIDQNIQRHRKNVG